MGALGLALLGSMLASRYFGADDSAVVATACPSESCPELVRYTVPELPSPTVTGTATPTRALTPSPTSVPARLGDAVASTPTVTATATFPPATATKAASPVVVAADVVADESYTSTNQVAPPPSAPPPPEPTAAPVCPAESTAQFELIPIEGAAARDHPDAVHGDLNLALRGFIPAAAAPELVTYNGSTDGDPPRLHGLFEPNRPARFTAVFRVNAWQWDSAKCGGHPRGCPAPPPADDWPVTLVGLAATPGEPVFAPERGAPIYPGGFVVMVLYAEEQRLTLGYTRRDTVSAGYTVHLEHLCVDPNLLALYRAQLDTDGWNASGHLPALRNNQALGTALDHQLGVAVRDAGTFMDPRSQKDWWR